MTAACLLCGCRDHVPLFHSSDRLYHTTKEKFAVLRCQECGLMRLDPQPAPDEVHHYYPPDYWYAPDATTAGRLEEAYRRFVLRDHVRFVEQALLSSAAKGPILDVGCGGGLFLGSLRPRGFSVVGLDFSREAAALAWKQNHAPAVCAALERAPFRPGSLAGVTMFHVLEHLHNPRRYLVAARELLAPDGRLIVQVPNAGCWQFRMLGRWWNGLDVPRHLFDYRDSDIAKMVEAAGFEVVRRKYFSLRDNPAGLASSLTPWLDPMARRVRRVRESGPVRLIKDGIYFGLTVAALPFAALEAAAEAGSTVMLEARRP